MSATLKLTHKTIGAEIRRGTYDAVVDGKAGWVPATERDARHTGRTRTPHPAGRKGRNSSQTKTFDAVEGETITFRCGGKRILPLFLLSFVIPSLALSLHRE